MAATASTMLPLGTLAPDFHLPDTAGSVVSRDDFSGCPALLVMFLCNHCPYVKRVAEEVVRLSVEYQARGVLYVPEAARFSNLLKLPDRDMRNIRGKDISVIFQEPMSSLNPVFTVGQQVAVGQIIGLIEAGGCGASDGRAESGKDHVASGDGLDGGADVRAHLLVSVGVVHLRHFFRGFKTAGESPIYELHGGDPFVV